MFKEAFQIILFRQAVVFQVVSCEQSYTKRILVLLLKISVKDTDFHTHHQKLGIHLENKVFQNLKLSKNKIQMIFDSEN